MSTSHTRIGRAARPVVIVLASGVLAVLTVAAARGRLAPVPPPAAADPPVLHPEVIRKPSGPPQVRTGQVDAGGQPVQVACNVCHTTRPTNLATNSGGQLIEFHQGLKVQHGGLSCASCHNPTDGYASLRLADGRSVPYTEVMQLCAQCHGTAYRDYQHGSHGGMTGYWDRSRGARARNNCIDCHDPHSPGYPLVRPAPGPRDRFLTAPHQGGSHD